MHFLRLLLTHCSVFSACSECMCYIKGTMQKVMQFTVPEVVTPEVLT